MRNVKYDNSSCCLYDQASKIAEVLLMEEKLVLVTESRFEVYVDLSDQL